MATATLTGQKTRPRRAANVWRRAKRYWFCYLMILGTFVLLITFSYYPAISAIWHSFTIWDGFRPATWNGLENYKEIFTTEDLVNKSFVNMILLALWQVVRAAVFPLL